MANRMRVFEAAQEIAASITPESTSESDDSTMRARKGIAAIDRGTMDAIVPRLVPTIRRDSGKTSTIRMTYGKERNIFIARSAMRFTKRAPGYLPAKRSCERVKSNIPNPPPSIVDINVEAAIIRMVSPKGRIRSRSISDIAVPLFFFFLEKSLCRFGTRIGEDFGHRALFDDRSAGDHRYCIADAPYDLFLMGNHDYGEV